MTEPHVPESAAPTQQPAPPDADRASDVKPAAPATEVDTDDIARRQQLTAALSGTVLEAAARRLAEAIADYDAALDRHAFMPELQLLDQEVVRAERDHTAATDAA